MKNIIVILFLTFGSLGIFAVEAVDVNANANQAPTTKVKYKDSSRIDFESLLIEGERKKPEMSVVTGNIGEKDNGLMIWRENFVDNMSSDFGEVIK